MGTQADDVNGVDKELRDLRLAVVTSQHRSLRQAAEALNIRQRVIVAFPEHLFQQSVANQRVGPSTSC